MTLVLLQVIWKQILVTQTGVIDEGDTREPVAVFHLSVTLDVVLTAGEVPHEVAPVHEVTLVGEEETDVLQL